MKAALPLILALLATPAAAQDIWVADGDTLHLDGRAFRLEGIDAPELGQTCHTARGFAFDCGKEARRILIRLVGAGPVQCDIAGRDRYGRALAHCSAGGVELNRALVAAGMARAYVHYSGEYLANEDEARAAAKGLWAGSWQAPWEWRAEHPKN